jgi:hypothetical protein
VDENNVYSQDKQLQKPDSYQRSNYVPISDATPNWNETAKDFKVIVVKKTNLASNIIFLAYCLYFLILFLRWV